MKNLCRSLQIKTKLIDFLSIFIMLLISSNLYAESSSYSVIPLKFYSREPIAKIFINGVATNLIVDLGTSSFDLMLSKQVLTRSGAKLSSIDNKNFFSNYRRQKYPIKTYSITQVQLGDYKLHNLSALGFPGMGFFSDDPAKLSPILNNGTIGVNLLKKFNIIFDYQHHKMVLIKNNAQINEYKVDEWKRIPIYYASDNILTRGSIGKVPVRIILDTGNNALTMSLEILQKIKSVTKDGVIKDDEHQIVSNLSIGNYLLKAQTFEVHNTHPEADISLGWDFFKNHVVYFNFKEKYMAIKQSIEEQ